MKVKIKLNFSLGTIKGFSRNGNILEIFPETSLHSEAKRLEVGDKVFPIDGVLLALSGIITKNETLLVFKKNKKNEVILVLKFNDKNKRRNKDYNRALLKLRDNLLVQQFAIKNLDKKENGGITFRNRIHLSRESLCRIENHLIAISLKINKLKIIENKKMNDNELLSNFVLLLAFASNINFRLNSTINKKDFKSLKEAVKRFKHISKFFRK